MPRTKKAATPPVTNGEQMDLTGTNTPAVNPGQQKVMELVCGGPLTARGMTLGEAQQVLSTLGPNDAVGTLQTLKEQGYLIQTGAFWRATMDADGAFCWVAKSRPDFTKTPITGGTPPPPPPPPGKQPAKRKAVQTPPPPAENVQTPQGVAGDGGEEEGEDDAPWSTSQACELLSSILESLKGMTTLMREMKTLLVPMKTESVSTVAAPATSAPVVSTPVVEKPAEAPALAAGPHPTSVPSWPVGSVPTPPPPAAASSPQFSPGQPPYPPPVPGQQPGMASPPMPPPMQPQGWPQQPQGWPQQPQQGQPPQFPQGWPQQGQQAPQQPQFPQQAPQGWPQQPGQPTWAQPQQSPPAQFPQGGQPMWPPQGQPR